MNISLKSKEDLITEIERRVEDKIIERANADLIIKLINNSDNISEAIAIAQLGTTYKRTGFHFDKRLEKYDNTIKYFKKNEKLSFVSDNNGNTHKLIIGDNYDALLNLLIEYRSRIDVIYIDPPYGKDDMGEFAETNYDNGITRDNLLSMLYSRLTIAKELLSDSGFILCSIDDKNQAYVKCLFDEIFGDRNFIGNFVINAAPNGRDYGPMAKQHEYCLLYSKNMEDIICKKIKVENKKFSYEDSIGGFNIHPLYNSNVAFSPNNRPNLYYPFYVNPEPNDDGFYNISLEKEKGFIEVYPPMSVKGDAQFVWRWGREKSKKNLNKEIIGHKVNEGFRIVQKMRQSDKLIRSLLIDNSFSTRKGTAELESILGKKMFSYPKPKDLIKILIEVTCPDDGIVLDFFAGSGTTGHAVLELNKEDDGNRQFILCTNNEITDVNPNGIAYDVTTKRLKRIMTGECYDGTKDFDWIKNNESYGDNLDVYEIEKVANFELSENKTPFDVIDETLYGFNKFENIKDKIEWVCNNFEHTQKYLELSESVNSTTESE